MCISQRTGRVMCKHVFCPRKRLVFAEQVQDCWEVGRPTSLWAWRPAEASAFSGGYDRSSCWHLHSLLSRWTRGHNPCRKNQNEWKSPSLLDHCLKKAKQSPVRGTSQHFHSHWHHMNEVLAKWLNIPRSICFLSVRYKRRNCGHSHQEICMTRNTVICLDGIGVDTAVLRLFTIRVNDSLNIGALASLDEKQLGLFSQSGAFAPNEWFHQLLDVDSDAVHAVHTPLLAVAENATRHTVPFSLGSVGQVLHQDQYLFARTVLVNLHLKAEPGKDFFQTLWKVGTSGKYT